KGRHVYNPDFIEAFARRCIQADEDCLRILYYDCAPFTGTVVLPVSGTRQPMTGSATWLDDLASRDLFAVRRGVLKFRGFKRINPTAAAHLLTDADFK